MFILAPYIVSGTRTFLETWIVLTDILNKILSCCSCQLSALIFCQRLRARPTFQTCHLCLGKRTHCLLTGAIHEVVPLLARGAACAGLLVAVRDAGLGVAGLFFRQRTTGLAAVGGLGLHGALAALCAASAVGRARTPLTPVTDDAIDRAGLGVAGLGLCQIGGAGLAAVGSLGLHGALAVLCAASAVLGARTPLTPVTHDAINGRRRSRTLQRIQNAVARSRQQSTGWTRDAGVGAVGSCAVSEAPVAGTVAEILNRPARR